VAVVVAAAAVVAASAVETTAAAVVVAVAADNTAALAVQAPGSVEAEPERTPLDPDLVARASAVGESWAHDYVRDLRSQARDIVGGWPGTLREARRRLLAAMPRDIDPQHFDELARITNLAARRGWESVSEPDLEP
jgi:hypothetical protein